MFGARTGCEVAVKRVHPVTPRCDDDPLRFGCGCGRGDEAAQLGREQAIVVRINGILYLFNAAANVKPCNQRRRAGGRMRRESAKQESPEPSRGLLSDYVAVCCGPGRHRKSVSEIARQASLVASSRKELDCHALGTRSFS